MVCASPASPAARRRRWHRQFLALLPQIGIHAKIAFRHLNPEARAEMVEEVVYFCLCKGYARMGGSMC